MKPTIYPELTLEQKLTLRNLQVELQVVKDEATAVIQAAERVFIDQAKSYIRELVPDNDKVQLDLRTLTFHD